MARELKITKAYKSELYDSDTDAECVTEKVVDVTEDCPRASKEDRCVFLYTRRVGRGRIIQMTRPYKGKEYTGRHIHFFVDELEREMDVAPRDDTFGSWARQLGLSKPALCSLIEAHAPTA